MKGGQGYVPFLHIFPFGMFKEVSKILGHLMRKDRINMVYKDNTIYYRTVIIC